MAILPIVTYPSETLKIKCENVEVFDSELHTILNNMAETMYDAPGIGIAAPQVGILKQITVIDLSEDGSELIELINPIIVNKEGSFTSEEGCLSIPGYRASIKRAEKVLVKAQNRLGEEFEIEGEELLSFCLQHEIDHLNGVLFTDKLSRLKKSLFLTWYKKNEPLIA
ncbi:UNVERIFIED_CONTAM: hypothetical protein GTU68_035615 [Idotea baltica]|nr:hypothetical protein [Idotea baltica]